MTRRRAIGWLVLVTLVWGSTFTLTKTALASISPLLFMGARFTVATVALAGVFRHLRWSEVRAGLVLGALFWTGFVFQTKGLDLTTPSRSAFITSLSSALTPVVALLAHRAAPGKLTIGGIALAMVGTYLLTAPDAGGMNAGDTLTVGCAVVFAGHIVAASYYARRFDPARLLAVQLGLTAVLSFAAAPLLETPRFTPDAVALSIIALLGLTGLWSFYMQLRAQREVHASDAALVFVLEPVFAALISFFALGERLTPIQWIGGMLILGALAVPAIAAGQPETAET
jgi:drug/metabolite transporter (DMT)-like permease